MEVPSLAAEALVEAADPAKGELVDGPATTELRAMLRCEGVGGPLYYDVRARGREGERERGRAAGRVGRELGREGS